VGGGGGYAGRRILHGDLPYRVAKTTESDCRRGARAADSVVRRRGANCQEGGVGSCTVTWRPRRDFESGRLKKMITKDRPRVLEGRKGVNLVSAGPCDPEPTRQATFS